MIFRFSSIVYNEIVDSYNFTNCIFIIKYHYKNLNYGIALSSNFFCNLHDVLEVINQTNLQVAIPDLLTACKDSDILIFVIPHQFVENVCIQLKGHLKEGALVVSLIKVVIFIVW